MLGDVHYRRSGTILKAPPTAVQAGPRLSWAERERRHREHIRAGRHVWMHAVPLRTASLITDGDGHVFDEIWEPGSLVMPSGGRPSFSLRHLLQGEHRSVTGRLYPASEFVLGLPAGEAQCTPECSHGRSVGKVTHVLDGGAWIDVVARVDDGPAGDAFLSEVGADGGRLPVSITFKPTPGGTVRDHRRGVPVVTRRRVELLEVAVVDEAALSGAVTFARGGPPDPGWVWDMDQRAAQARADRLERVVFETELIRGWDA